MHHLHDEFRGGSGLGVDVRLALPHNRDHVGCMIRLFVNG